MQLSLSLMCHVCTLQLVIVSHLQLLSVTAANGLKISSDRSDIFRLELHIVMTAEQIETAAVLQMLQMAMTSIYPPT